MVKGPSFAEYSDLRDTVFYELSSLQSVFKFQDLSKKCKFAQID